MEVNQPRAGLSFAGQYPSERARQQLLMRPGPHPPKWVFLGKKFLLAQVVQFFVAVPTVPRGTLGGAYCRTYPHLLARYRGWVGGVRAVFAVLSQLLGAAKKTHLGGYGPAGA